METASREALPTSVHEELTALIKACRLENPRLESQVRKVLGMPPTKAEIAQAAAQKKAAQIKALKQSVANSAEARQQKIRQVAEAGNCSHDRASKAIDNAGGDADMALVMLLSEETAQQSKKNADKIAAKKAMKAAEKAAVQDTAREANGVAHALAALAPDTHRLAWEKMQSEFSGPD